MEKKILLFISLFLPFFVYSQASLNSITPSGGHPMKILNVTITGTNTHFSTSNGTVVKFGFNQGSATSAVNKTTIVNPSTIIANITVPGVPFGNYDVTVDNSTDGSLTLSNGFSVFQQPTPSLVSVSPSSIPAGKTVNVTIIGHNTNFTSALGLTSSVDFRSIGNSNNVESADSITIVDDTIMKVDFTFPATTFTGDYNLNVSNSTDGNIYLIKGLHVTGLPSPTFVSVSPASAAAGQTLNVTITGANSHFKQGKDTKVVFGFNQATGTTTVNSETIANDSLIYANVTVPAYQAEGDYAVYVDDSIDGTITLLNGFHVKGVPPPVLMSISPSTVNAGQTLDVTITGANTHFQQSGNIGVSFGFDPVSGATVVNSITVIDTLTLKVNITVPPHTYTGNYYLGVSNAVDGSLFLYSALHVNGVPPPELISITPSTAEVGKALIVTITGAHTHFSSTNSTTLGFIPGSSTIVINSATILNEYTIEAHITVLGNTSPGDYSVVVVDTTDGTIVLENGFHVTDKPQPTIVSINPSGANAGQTLNVIITGVNNHFKQGGGTILDFKFKPVSSTTIVNSMDIINDTSIQASINVPLNTYTGDYDVSVTDSVDGQRVLINGFHVNGNSLPPGISIDPGGIPVNETANINIRGIRGTHFNHAASKTAINFVGAHPITINSKTVVNDTLIALNITAPGINGAYQVIVNDSIDGQMKGDFKIYSGCTAFYKTTYDVTTNVFTLRLDSITSLATSFHWDFGDGTTSTDSFPSHVFTENKIYNVCLQITNAMGDSCSYCHQIGKDSLGNPIFKTKGFSMHATPYKELVTGIPSIEDMGHFISVYPNPADNLITIVSSTAISALNKPILSIYSIDGKLLLQQAFVKEKMNLDVNAFKKGIYIMQLTGSKQTEIIKFAKE